MQEDKPKRLGELLLERGLINEEQLDRALELQQTANARLGSLLINIKAISEEDLLNFLALYFDCQFFDLRGFHAAADVLAALPPDTAKKYRILPLEISAPEQGAAELIVGTNDQTNLDALYQASRVSGYNVQCRVVSDHELAAALLRHYGPDARPEIMGLAEQLRGLEAEALAELLGMLAEKQLVNVEELLRRLQADKADSAGEDRGGLI